ncbi:MAG: phage tail spike protein, partial [Intestinibacter bartlettii]|uniref:phage tail spike protein n=1 Tax=Intestinibacter bartlettii TaxID=261299 RepID=UPI00291286E2
MIYIYNRDEIQIDSLDIEPKFTEEIGKLRTLEFESEKKYEKGYRVVALIDNIAYEFVIIDTEYSRNNIIENSYFCQDSLIELQAIPIMDLRPQGGIDKALSSILKDTRWKFELINGYNTNQYSKNSFYHISALQAFSEIVETYRSEWITEYRFSESKITERKILIYQRDGRSKGRLEFGKNIVKFQRKILSEPIITAIIPFGKGEEKESGAFGRRIGIEDINDGIPYIENKVATKIYGIGDKGNKLPLFGFLTLEDITDPHELKKLAQEELDIVSQPRAECVVDAIDLDIEAKIGYEVPTIDEEIGYRSYSRIKKIVREGKDIKLTFGSVTKKFTDSFQKEIKSTKKEFNNVYEQLNYQMESADGKTTIYTGASKPNNPSNGDMWYRENTDGSVDMLFYKDGEWTERISERLFKEF